MVDGLQLVLLGLAAAAGGVVNALAGGGTLITFPALLAAGIPPITANVTNTVALCPGYLGAALAQRADLAMQRGWMRRTLPAALVGGFAGGVLLLMTGERLFDALVPYLILFAAGLVAVQETLRAWLLRRTAAAGVAAGAAAGGPPPLASAEAASARWAAPAVGATAVYSGYFGAGASVIVLAGLGLTLGGPLPRLNALKQTLALASNVAAALLFVFTGPVAWRPALVMAVATFAGGTLGGRLAGRLSPVWLRRVVVVIGVAAGFAYLLR
jgi:uncharacterized membrane protein YfcA